MKKKAGRRQNQQAKGKELGEAELEQAVGGVALQPSGPTLVDSAGVEQAEMMKVQMAMQQENTTFSSVSNVLKTRHDTTKNSITNIR